MWVRATRKRQKKATEIKPKSYYFHYPLSRFVYAILTCEKSYLQQLLIRSNSLVDKVRSRCVMWDPAQIINTLSLGNVVPTTLSREITEQIDSQTHYKPNEQIEATKIKLIFNENAHNVMRGRKMNFDVYTQRFPEKLKKTRF